MKNCMILNAKALTRTLKIPSIHVITDKFKVAFLELQMPVTASEYVAGISANLKKRWSINSNLLAKATCVLV